MSLPDLIAKAKKERKWICCHYQDIWLSPEELERENANGKFIWGEINFTLLNPNERRKQLEDVVAQSEDRLRRFNERVSEWEKGQK